MILVIKLISGEEIIGELESVPDTQFYNISNPMSIVDGYDEYGTITMKLRDAMLLSDETLITIPEKSVITYYPASEIMIKYYRKAVIFAKQYTKKKIEGQIKEATVQLDEYMSESSIEKVLRELRLRGSNPGSGTVN